MESRKAKSNSLEHRRAQNRMAQRRFRQRQSQQKVTGTIIVDQQQPQINPRTRVLDPPARSSSGLHAQQDFPVSLVEPKPLKVHTPSFELSGLSTTNTSSTAVASLNASYGFGVTCLQGRNNGLLGIQNFMNMDNLNLSPSDLETTFSNLSSVLSSDRSKAMSIKDIPRNSGLQQRKSSLKMPGSIESVNWNSSAFVNVSESVKVAVLPKPIAPTEDLAPATSSSSRSLYIGSENHHDSGSASFSPLHIAAQKGHDGIVRVLLQHNIDSDEPDSDGLTPLMQATIGGYEDVVTSLLAHGVSIEKVDSQSRSVLHWAVLYRREALLKLLLDRCRGEKGVLDGCECEGRTPLILAVEEGFEAGVRLLLLYGASVRNMARVNSVVV